MAISFAPDLITIAQSGARKLTTRERRLCLQYLQATAPAEHTNGTLAQWFQVSERTIRLDRQWVREEKSNFLKDELKKDLGLVIADIAMDFERQVGDLERSKKSAKLGSYAYVQHAKEIFDMRLKMVAAFQEIGYLPKNLGNMTVNKFSYKATVALDGSVNTRTEQMFDEQEAALKKLPAPTTVEDAEFTDVPKELLLQDSSKKETDSGSQDETELRNK